VSTPNRCSVIGSLGYRAPAGDLAGVRTLVTDPNADQPPATSHGRYKQRALPTPPWVHKKPMENWVYNAPGPSDTAPGGKSIHEDKVRTKGEPGKMPPDPEPRKRPKRRDIEGAVRGKPYPASRDRQKKQRAQAKRYYKRWYRRNRSRVRRRSERWNRRWRRRIQFKRDKRRRRDHPDRFERRPGGGIKQPRERALKDRAKKQEERGKPGKQKSKKKASQPIPFIHLPTNRHGLLISIDPDTGMAHVEISLEYNPETDAHILIAGTPQDIPVDILLDEVLIPNEADIERLAIYLDEVFEWEANGDLEGDTDEPCDQVLDEWFEGQGFQVVAYKVRQRPQKRQRRQKGVSRIKSRQNYRKNRQRSRQKAKLRYKKQRKNPLFKRQQKIRKKNPQRFRRRRGGVLVAPEIAFVIGRGYQIGYVHAVSPMTGLVTFQRADNAENVTAWQSLAVPDFLASVGFLSDEDIDAMFRLIDAEIGLEGYRELTEEGVRQSALLEDVDCDSDQFRDECEQLTGKREMGDMSPAELTKVDSFVVNTVIYDDPDDEEPHGDETVTPEDRYMIDPTDDDCIYGTVNVPEDWIPLVRRVAGRYSDILLIERRPPDDRGTWRDRATPSLVKEIDQDEHTPANKPDLGQVTDNPGSAKVMPNNKDLVNNTDWKTWGWDPPRLPDVAASIRHHAIIDLGEYEQEALVELVKSPLWERYSVGLKGPKDIFRWFRDKGIRMTAHRWNQIMTRLHHMVPSSRFAARISDIRNGCSSELHQKAQSVPVRLRRVDARNAMWLFDAKGTSSTYRVRVKVKAKKNIRDPRKADVLVSCSCPFWRWQGPEYWAKKGGFLLGRPRGTASRPDVKDPKGHHWACKHILAVLEKVMTYSIPGRGKTASLRYLADRIESGRVHISFEKEERIIRAVADRYLVSMGKRSSSFCVVL